MLAGHDGRCGVTDARFPERWLNDRRILRLPDSAFRLFVMALAWSAANRTDGVLYDDDLALIQGADPGAAGDLVKAGLWARAADYWAVTVFEGTQTTSADLEHLDRQRRMARDRKRRERARKADAAVTRDVTRDSTRPGQARTGQDRHQEEGGTTGEPPCEECGTPVGPLGQAETRRQLGRVLCSACRPGEAEADLDRALGLPPATRERRRP
jgi:hypothetical protein